MPNMIYIQDGGFHELVLGRTYEITRQYIEDDENYVDVIGETGRTMHGIYADRFEPVEKKLKNVSIDAVGIWAHHKQGGI